MATLMTVSDLAKLPNLKSPVITLNLDLRQLSFDQDERVRVRTMLRKIQKEIGSDIQTFVDQVDGLTREQLPYEGITVITDNDGQDVYYLPRTTVSESDYHIEDSIDFLLLLSEAPNEDYTLLELNRDNSKLYRLQDKRVSPLAVEKYPATVEDALGDEIRGGELNFSAKGGSTQFHGHNETSQEKKIDQERYYHYIIDLLKDDATLKTHKFILMGLPQNINLFRKLSKGLSVSNIQIDQSVQSQPVTEIAKLVNSAIDKYNQENTSEAINKTYRDNLYTDFGNIQDLLNSRRIRRLFVASRDQINSNDPESYGEINKLIKRALSQDTSVTVIKNDPTVPLVSAV